MKRTLIAVVTGLVLTASAPAQTTWTVDIVHSNVKFTVSHLVIAEVDGNFKVYSGIINAKPDFSDATVEFAVDVTSINTENEMRDKHLKSDDFFNAEKFPKMTFKSTSWKNVGEQSYILEGDLTIRDVTKRVAFSATYGGTIKDPWGNTKAGFKATSTINRFDYGLKWNTLTEAGGATVGKDVGITVNLELTQKKSS